MFAGIAGMGVNKRARYSVAPEGIDEMLGH
jgi:hypothetical protein